jgi:hypothetical protein
MKHSVAHDLDQATAKKVTEKAFGAYKERFAEYNPTLEWMNDSLAETTFSAKGIKLKGSFELKPKAIAIELDVPFVLSMFKSKAVDIIEREIKAWVAKAKSGEI